jgi:hypothetical protein
MSKSLLEQAQELLKSIENNPEALKAFQELVKARAEESKHIEMEMSPDQEKKKRIDELSKKIKACMEKMQKESMDKDDKPHLPGTPEDKAHDVVEEGESVKEAIHGLKDKSEDSKKEMLSHLRSLKDKSQLRSPENREAGKEPHEKAETGHEKGVHQADYSTTYIKDNKIQHGISTAGIRAREASKPRSFKEYEESPKAAKAGHERVLEEIKQQPKPNLPKTEKAETEKSVHGVPGKNRPLHSRGIHETVSQSSSEFGGEAKEKSLAGLKVRRGDTAGAKKAHKEIVSEQKKMPVAKLPKAETEKNETYYRNLVKNTLEKQLMSPPFGMSEMEKEEDPREMVESSLMAIHRKANYLQKLLHEVCECKEVPAWVQDKLSSAKTHMTDVMDFIASQAGKGSHHEEQEMHPAETAEIVVTKSELEKAKIDEGKQLGSKIAARQERNIRDVITTKTPSGQKTRTARSSARREKELEEGKKPESLLSALKEHAERRKGEKIVGKPKTLENISGRDIRGKSAEQRAGVHMHSGSMAGKEMPIGVSAPVFADKKGKAYPIGGLFGENKYSSKVRHEEVMEGLKNIKPSLPKSEMKKEQLEPAPKPQSKPKMIAPPASGAGASDGGHGNWKGDGKGPKMKKPVKFNYKIAKAEKVQYYSNLVKSLLDKK